MESEEPTNLKPCAFLQTTFTDETGKWAFYESYDDKQYHRIYDTIEDYLEQLHTHVSEATGFDELVLDTLTNKYYIIGYEERVPPGVDEPIPYDFEEVDMDEIIFDML